MSNIPWAYSDTVKDHFLEPRNFLMGDEKKFPYNAKGSVGNKVCGDEMTMYLIIEDDIIQDVRWKTYGCASAIASTSALSELAKDKKLDDALKITAKEVADYLGGLPDRKFHCSVLGAEAIAEAIKDYRAK
ncbi:iron-sulfur cluster assembly scaffold protein [Candidatus Saccharibacteria bacterium]|nr:iron-sulfur cluster assembly scaffold protein [Candidatus Saccharibacteria bacterium]